MALTKAKLQEQFDNSEYDLGVTAADVGAAATSHNQAASTITTGTFPAKVVAYQAAATTDYTTFKVRNIKCGTSLPATSTAENGSVFILYTA